MTVNLRADHIQEVRSHTHKHTHTHMNRGRYSKTEGISKKMEQMRILGKIVEKGRRGEKGRKKVGWRGKERVCV